MRHTAATLLIILGVLLSCGTVQAALIGHWTFEGANPLADQTGNFPDLVLQGNASLTGGALNVNGTGTSATGWARTNPQGSYAGPPITNKTLVSYLTLEGLDNVAGAGSAITIEQTPSTDVDSFDGIVFAELESNRWQAGSTNFLRTSPFNPGFQETTVGQRIQVAITYEHLGGGTLRVTGYRNGQSIGQYTTQNASSWNTGGAEVVFGIRHILFGTPLGALDASIDEACIFDQALTPAQIVSIQNGNCSSLGVPTAVPTMGEWGMIIFMVLAGISSALMLRKRQQT